MSDKFERELREHLHQEAAQTPQFPRGLRDRIRDAGTPRARNQMAPQLALAGALVLIAVVALGARNSATVVKAVQSAIQVVVPTATPSPTLQPFSCSSVTGGNLDIPTGLTSIRSARHDGYDRVVFQFTAGIPSFDVVGQDSAIFIQDASGQPVTLDGNGGVKVILRATDPAGSSQDGQPKLASVQQIAQVGNFEHQLSYGIGLASPTCLRVLQLTNPARLVIDFDTSHPSATPSLAPTPAPTQSPAPGATPLGAFTCADHSGGSPTGTSPGQLTDIRIAHQPGYDRIVFQFAAGPVPTYTLTRQASAHFVKDASGQPVTLQGSAGLKLVFHGGKAYPTYTKSTDIKPGLPVVQEAAQLGDFESVLSWGIGLSQPACMRASELSGPTRLVIDVQTP
ncbi:MAG: hypothetical protein M3Z11_03160 [Candidatus Dormibacteraeota bacterium]|nr:hypothetical protein [Candidatus Dormibacteraeota bacterium]